MTRRTPAPGPAPVRLAGWAPFAVLLALLVATAVVLAPRGRGGGPPLDPSSPLGLGTLGLVETLRSLGAEVTVTREAPDASVDTALVLADDLGPRRRDEVAAWVRAGGTLLVADVSSPLNPWPVEGSASSGLFDGDLERNCSLPAVRGAGRVAPAGGVVLDAPASADRCYPRNGGHWLVAARAGEGNLVVVGGAAAFVNRHLDEAGNIAVATGVLAPRPGTRVAVLRPPLAAGGRASLADLVDPRVKAALWQLLVAFGVVAWWRARRLGRPVVEALPVALPGSELVVSVGNLLQRAGSRGRAAELLAGDLRRDLAARLGLPLALDPAAFAAAVAARTGADPAPLRAVLTAPPPAHDAELVALARRIDAVRQEVLRARTP